MAKKAEIRTLEKEKAAELKAAEEKKAAEERAELMKAFVASGKSYDQIMAFLNEKTHQ